MVQRKFRGRTPNYERKKIIFVLLLIMTRITNEKLRIDTYMATVYKVEVVSHWINYHPDDIEKAIKKALEDLDNNEITVKAERK